MLIKREEYRAYDAVNASYLKKVLSHSVWHANVPFEPTAAMLFGTAAHSYILEPETFDEEYKVWQGDRRTKAGKEMYQEILDAGQTPITQQDMVRLEMMRDHVMGNKATAELLNNKKEVELSLTFDSPYEPGLLCKGQIDLYTQDGWLVDLKTIADIDKAEKQFFNLHYDLQLAFYADALLANDMPVKGVKVLFVETAAPHQVALFEVPGPVLDNGTAKIKLALRKYLEQRELAEPELIQREIMMPSWASVLDEDDISPF
jgi:exodeoxyribonuclease VIII